MRVTAPRVREAVAAERQSAVEKIADRLDVLEAAVQTILAELDAKHAADQDAEE